MWQTQWSFAVGFLLSAGSSIAVADTAIRAGQGSQPLSVAEFARLVDNAGEQVGTPVAPAPVADPMQHEQTARNPSQNNIDPPAPQKSERRVRSISLVDFVEKASAEGTGVPRVSLVDLVSDDNPQQPVSAEPAGEAAAVAGAPSARGGPPTGDAENAGRDPDRQVSLQQPVDTESVAESVRTLSAPSEPPAGVVASAPAVRPILPTTAAAPEPAAATTLPIEERPAVRSVAVMPEHRPVRDDARAEQVFTSITQTDFDVDSNKLQLFEAVHSALSEHPAIVESLSRLDAQQEQISVARAGYLPQLRTGINTGYRHTTGRSEEALTLSASQMLYDFGKVSSAVEAAASGVDREEASVLLAAEDLIRETAQAFIEARRYEVLLELATEQIAAITELEELATRRSALGASSVSDQMQAKSRREAARAVQLQMQAQRDQWHSALEKLIGSSQGLTLDEAYPEPLAGVCSRLPENFDGAPQVLIADAERAEAEAGIRQARAEQRPTLSLNADFEQYLNRDTRTSQQLDDQEFVVSLNLTSNLFQGGALRARSRAAEHALYSADAARDRALLELSRFYREARDRSRSLTTSLALQDQRYASIVKTQELYRHQYLSLGTRTLLDILNTEQEIFQTQVDKQNTLFDLRSLQIDCLYSVGGLRDTFRADDALNRRVLSRRAEVGS